MIAVAIDGPAGAGKSTIARAVAERFGFTYVDTGALYRAVGLYMLRAGVDPSDAEQVCAVLPKVSLTLEYQVGIQHVFLCNEDVSQEIRTQKASDASSRVSAVPEVRKFLLDYQRNFAQIRNVIMDGRDIGTVILPNAQLKIFLTASVEERAKRRWEELKEKGEAISYEEVLFAAKERDKRDSTRAAAPLVAASDAVVVDTSQLSLEQSIGRVCDLLRERGIK